jgi:hypothetical protein
MSKADERIDSVCKALAAATNCDPRRDGEEDKKDAVVDLLTNMKHYAERHGWDFEELTEMADNNFEAERQEG